MSDEHFNAGGQSHFVSAVDGVRLHARVYEAASGATTPVLCLPGLARTGLDFDPLARALSEGRHGPARRVAALDYRGRGLSAFDPEGVYEPATETRDVLTVAAALGIGAAYVVGTSRGGLNAMLLSVVKRDMLRGIVFNDVGPRLETAGLERIRGYVGKTGRPRDLDEAVAMLRTTQGAQFPGLSEEDWRAFAATTFKPDGDGLALRYDPRLAQGLATLDLTKPLPEMWAPFEALKGLPTLALRGERSDLLSAATLDEMAARLPGLETAIVAGQGHAPLLRDEATIGLIARTLARWDATTAPG